MASDIRLQPKKITKTYTYSCEWCFFTIDNEKERMIQHCLMKHGVTNKFSKGYKIKIRRTTKG
jgi:hypothetical protein